MPASVAAHYPQSGILGMKTGPGTGRRDPFDSYNAARKSAAARKRATSLPPRRKGVSPNPDDDDPGDGDWGDWEGDEEEDDWEDEEEEEQENDGEEGDDDGRAAVPQSETRAGGGSRVYDPLEDEDSSGSSELSAHSEAQSDGALTLRRKRRDKDSVPIKLSRTVKEAEEL